MYFLNYITEIGKNLGVFNQARYTSVVNVAVNTVRMNSA